MNNIQDHPSADIKIPSQETRQAIEALENRSGQRFNTIEELMDKLKREETDTD